MVKYPVMTVGAYGFKALLQIKELKAGIGSWLLCFGNPPEGACSMIPASVWTK
jgi:hypothetical protein